MVKPSLATFRGNEWNPELLSPTDARGSSTLLGDLAFSKDDAAFFIPVHLLLHHLVCCNGPSDGPICGVGERRAPFISNLAGCIVAAAFGALDGEQLRRSGWFGIPELPPLGLDFTPDK